MRGWIDPQGKFHDVHGAPTHVEWLWKTFPDTFPVREDKIFTEFDALDAGWIRVNGGYIKSFHWDTVTQKVIFDFVEEYPAAFMEEGLTIEFRSGRTSQVFPPKPKV